MLVEFSKSVQALTERLDREVKPDEILRALIEMYAVDSGPYRLVDYDLLHGAAGAQRCTARVEASEQMVTISGEGSGPIEAFVNGIVEVLNEPLNIIDYHEHAMSTGKDAQAICLLAIDDGAQGRIYGIGVSANTITASLSAIISAMNRRWSDDRCERSIAEHLDLDVGDHVVLDLQRFEQVVADSDAEVRFGDEL